MALEGARQIAQKDRQITGYQLKDTTFSSPISISPARAKSEAQLFMRPLRKTYEKDNPSFQFRIFIFEDSHWNEACQGTINVEYEGTPSEVDAGREDFEKCKRIKEQYEEAIRTCNRPVETKRMYQVFKDIGLNYGPAFQRLQNLAWDGGGEAIGEIQTPRWCQSDAQGHVQSHVIHPVTLDTAAQLMWVSLTAGASKSIPTGVPTRIRSAWISSTGLGYPDATTLRGYTRSCFKGLRGTSSSMFAVDQTNNLKISLSGLETTNVSGGDQYVKQYSNARNFCYSKEWKPDVSLMTPQQSLAYCEADKGDTSEPRDFYQDLEFLLLVYISETLQQVSQDEVDNSKPHLRKYYDWLMMQHQKSLQSQAGLSKAGHMLRYTDALYLESLADYLETANAQGKLYITVGRDLASILRGTADPLALLFDNGIAEAFYQNLFDSTACCRRIWYYLDGLAHKNPGLRILEVGAGTGAMTGHVLAPLFIRGEGERGAARFARYDYTDISVSFFETARQKFATEIPNIRFRSLNIEHEPTEQGFEQGSYDLVVASSVGVLVNRDV